MSLLHEQTNEVASNATQVLSFFMTFHSTVIIPKKTFFFYEVESTVLENHSKSLILRNIASEASYVHYFDVLSMRGKVVIMSH